jgi:predicted DNA-binding transcriptional regulator YafY
VRRADRLFQIVQILRRGRLVTARDLAERLEVSERTVYRDMRDLAGSGVPVDGEAGVGYVMRKGYDLPPLAFTKEEVEALAVGARLLNAWAGGALSAAARSAIDKIETAMPEARRAEWTASRIHALDFNAPPGQKPAFDHLHRAVNERRIVVFNYRREDGAPSRRRVRPFGLYFWGAVWTLAAWCELRGAYRNFRIDRMEGIDVLEETFVETETCSLSGFLAQVNGEG